MQYNNPFIAHKIQKIMALDERVREAVIISTGPDSKRQGINIDLERAQKGLERYQGMNALGDAEAYIIISGALNDGEYEGSQPEAIADYLLTRDVEQQHMFFEPHSNSFADKAVYLGQGLEKLEATQVSLILDALQAQRMEILLRRAQQEKGFRGIDIIHVSDGLSPSYSGFKRLWKPRLSLIAAGHQRIPEKLPFERFLMPYNQLRGFLS